LLIFSKERIFINKKIFGLRENLRRLFYFAGKFFIAAEYIFRKTNIGGKILC